MPTPRPPKTPRHSLTIMQGIPGSGKSTWARNMQWESQRLPGPEIVVTSRDDLRMSLFYSYYGGPIDEQFIKDIQIGIVNRALLLGKSVIVDDTNLRAATVDLWRLSAKNNAVPFRIKQMPMHSQADVDRAFEQNEQREKQVPRGEIHRMFMEFHDVVNQMAIKNLGLDPSNYID